MAPSPSDVAPSGTTPSPTSAPNKKPRTWVEDDNGKPRIRWRAMAPVIAILAVQIVATAALTLPWEAPPGMRVPFLKWIVAYELIFVAGVAIIYVELQRQTILSGKPKWQIGMGAAMLLMVLAAILFGLLGNEYRVHRHERDLYAYDPKVYALNDIVKGQEWEDLVSYVVKSSRDPRNLNCYVTRRSFGNYDLARLIKVASENGKVPCPIERLFLDVTSVDEKGLRDSLAKMPQLVALGYFRDPSVKMTVDDATVDAIVQHCPNLRRLNWKVSEFTPVQLDRIRTRFPNLKINNQTWEDYDQKHQ